MSFKKKVATIVAAISIIAAVAYGFYIGDTEIIKYALIAGVSFLFGRATK